MHYSLFQLLNLFLFESLRFLKNTDTSEFHAVFYDFALTSTHIIKTNLPLPTKTFILWQRVEVLIIDV